AAGAPGRLATERGPLVAVELDHCQRLVLGSSRQLFEGRVHEHPDDLEPPPERPADLGRDGRLGEARALEMVVQPDRPGAEARRLTRGVEIRHAAELDLHTHNDTGPWWEPARRQR